MMSGGDGNVNDIILYGGAGNDTISINTANFRRLDGGLGRDTLALAGSVINLDLTDTADNTRLAGIEEINLTTGNNTLTLSYGALLNLVEETTATLGFNTLRVVGDSGDTLSANLPGFAIGDAGTFTNYTKGNLRLTVSDSVTQNITMVR